MSPKTWKWLCIFVLWVQLSWEKYSCFILWHKMREKNTVNYNSKPFVFTCWATAQGYVLVTTLILEVCCLRKPRGASGDIFFFGDTFSKSDLNWFPTVFMTLELVNPFYFHFFLENVFSCVEKKNSGNDGEKMCFSLIILFNFYQDDLCNSFSVFQHVWKSKRKYINQENYFVQFHTWKK